MPLKIGITDCSKWADYESWIKNASEDIEAVLLKAGEGEDSFVSHCDGVILIGEGDNTFERNVLKEAEEYKIPILGIGKGLQVGNIYFKGASSSGLSNEKDAAHSVSVTKNTRLHHIVGVEKGEIDSHHQTVDEIGKGLIANAISDDGIVEGLEKAKKHDAEFFLLVQWHPERMDANNPFSGKLRTAFLKACEEYNKYSDLTQSIIATP